MANTPPWDGIPIYGWELVEAVGPYCRLLWVLMDAEEGDSEVRTRTRPLTWVRRVYQFLF